MRLSATRLTSIAQAGGGRTLIQRAIAILRRYGQDAHIYLPGVGMMNGLQAGNYLDSAGTTQGTVDRPVGLVLDAAGSLGVELVSNPGPFLSLSGWAVGNASASISLAGENIRVTRQTAGANWPNVRTVLTGLTIGRSYQIKTKLVNPFGIQVYHSVLGTALAESRTFASGDIFSVFVATATSHSLDVGIWDSAGTVGQYMEFSSSSFREVTGTHAQQPTTASKPILRRGAVNLLTHGGDFSNAAWFAGGDGVFTFGTSLEQSPDGVAATSPYGTYTSSGRQCYQTKAIVNTPMTLAVWVKATVQSRSIGLFINDGGIASSHSIGSDWQLLVLSGTVGAVLAGSGRSGFRNLQTWASGDVLIGSAALFAGTYTAAQIQALGGIPLTTTAPASTALGPMHWAFDGSNDSLSLGSVPFQISDDFWVVGVVNGAAVAGDQIFLGLRTGANMILCGSNGVSIDFFLRDAASTSSRCLSVAGIVAGTPYVYGARRLAGIQTVRKDGLVKGTDSTVLGASLISSGSIGYDNNSVYLTGGIYPIAFGKGAITEADLLLIEKALGQIAGVQI